MGLPVIAGAVAAHPVSPAAVSTTTLAAAGKPNYPQSPNPGTLTIDDDFGGSIATSEDPAVDYETIGYEAILNTFETLISYNGSSSTGANPQAFVPVLATCVPGTVQCHTDYPSAPGTDLIVDNGAGQPQYYTFVIDPAAHFYDPSTGHSWKVYPTDVMFSLARDMMWSETAGVGTTAGWLIAQTLLPNGTTGIHVPYETTPSAILGSMLINDSSYCPSNAMNGAQGDGCVTFNVTGQGATWPTSLFLQVIADGFNAVESCAWYSSQGANITGWDAPDNGSSPDSSCLLPDGQTTTDNSAWTTYLSGLPSTLWDNLEELLPIDYPAPNPNVQWNAVGSGPYYSIERPTGSPPGYSLFANPGYVQPSGCSGAGGLATYPDSYCWPAANGYAGNVTVNWESTDTAAITGYKDKAIDFGGILSTDTSTLLNLSNQSLLHYFVAPSLSTFFLPINLDASSSGPGSAYASDGFDTYGTVNVPDDFMSGEAARQLVTHAYQYASAEAEAWTVDGVPYLYPAGGPIAEGMNYYPTNVSYPSGNAITNPNVFGSAAWWWAQGTNSSSHYYDPELAACTTSSPCRFDIVGETGNPGLDISLALLINSIKTITNNAVIPFTMDFNFAAPPPDLIGQQLATGPGSGPLMVYNLGWAPDNFDPEDYLVPMAFPDSTYTFSDAVAEQFQVAQYDNAAVCGNSVSNYSNLIFWAKQPALNNSCEGVAYNVVSGMFYSSTHETNPTVRGIEYWAIQNILNNLGLYIWYGQANQVTSFAPWINPSSINTNPSIGGGGDQLWFQIRYVPFETQVTFTEKGLPSGSTFNVTASSGGSAGIFNTSNGTASTSFFEPTGALSYQFQAPAGYAVSKVAGPKGTTTSSSTVSGSVKGTPLTVTFVAVNTLTFTETGLPTGTPWDVNLTWAAKTGAPNGNPADASYSGTSTSTSLSFSVAGGSWKYVVSVPADFKVNSAKGSVGVKTTASTPASKALKFTLVTSNVAFSEKGLAKNTQWGITLTGATNGTPIATCGAPTTKGSFTCKLEAGTYDFTVNAVAGYTAAPASGSIIVAPPSKVAPVKITFTAA